MSLAKPAFPKEATAAATSLEMFNPKRAVQAGGFDADRCPGALLGAMVSAAVAKVGIIRVDLL